MDFRRPTRDVGGAVVIAGPENPAGHRQRLKLLLNKHEDLGLDPWYLWEKPGVAAMPVTPGPGGSHRRILGTGWSANLASQ